MTLALHQGVSLRSLNLWGEGAKQSTIYIQNNAYNADGIFVSSVQPAGVDSICPVLTGLWEQRC